MFIPQSFQLTAHDKLHQLVEHKTSFNLNRVELNLYETNERCMDYQLRFAGFTITSMLRGKKKIRFEQSNDMNYVPGNSVISPSGAKLSIDFPDANLQDPTQCSALVIDDTYLKEQINYFNESAPKSSDSEQWQFSNDPVLLNNNRELAAINTRIIKTLSSSDPYKDIQADLLLKELVLCVLRLQNLNALDAGTHFNANHSPLQAVINYIRTQLNSSININELCRIACMSRSSFYRTFTHELGISPNQLIIRERIRLSKQLLQDRYGVKEAGFASGFADTNYFVRTFRQAEGITPGEFKKLAVV
jgi:AraC-like DNA-binding protein